MSDQELDDLFKEASAKYEAPFDEKEWEKMAAMLDSTPSPKPGFWNWKIISGIALLLLMSGTVLITQWDKIDGSVEKGSKTNEIITASKEDVSSTIEENKLGQDHSTDQSSSKVVIDENEKTETIAGRESSSSQSQLNSTKNVDVKNEKLNTIRKSDEAISVGGRVKANSKNSIAPDKQENKVKYTDLKNTDSIDGGKKIDTEKPLVITTQQSSSDEKIKASENKSEMNSVEEKAIASNSVKNEKDKELSDNNQIGGNEEVAKEKKLNSLFLGNNAVAISNKNSLSNEKTSPATVNAESDVDDNDSNLLQSNGSKDKMSEWRSSDSAAVVVVAQVKKDSVVSKEVVRKEKKNKNDSAKISRFSVKVALSPDFSSIGYFKPGKTGFNYGLLAEYNITRHWSITLGGIWSRKIYNSTMTENAGYGTVNSTYIDGSCRVLDLPLNINYYITPQNAFTLYGSVGLSSYFMFDEDYTYDYVYGTKQYSYSKKIDRGNTEWFRMMNLSIGIQQQLSSRMRVQLEPFIKAPLSGIGGGDLKLVSSGVFLNLKYTFK